MMIVYQGQQPAVAISPLLALLAGAGPESGPVTPILGFRERVVSGNLDFRYWGLYCVR